MDLYPRADSPHFPLATSGAKAFIDRRRARCRNSTINSDSNLQIDYQWSDQRHLGCFRTVNLQFQGPFVPISLRPVLRVVEAYVIDR